jgi:hypothetical protein
MLGNFFKKEENIMNNFYKIAVSVMIMFFGAYGVVSFIKDLFAALNIA